jgi:hypothetical protein
MPIVITSSPKNIGPTFTGVAKMTRPIYIIAEEILNDMKRQSGQLWHARYAYAAPYLTAMLQVNKMTDTYGADNASTVVSYFLSNAQAWRGEHAKRIKAELNDMLKAHRNAR